MYEYKAIVVSIYDGDTVRLDVDLGMSTWLGNVSVRVAGIDAPEVVNPDGKAARAHAKLIMPPKTKVTIRTTRDKKEKYGRYLAEIILPDGTSFAEVMIAAGHATKYSGGKRG